MGQIKSRITKVTAIEKNPETAVTTPESVVEDREEEYLSNPNAEKQRQRNVEQISAIISGYNLQEWQYLNFPFFTNPESVTYIHGSKILFIMKGLPGSGKSTVAIYLQSMFNNCVRLSADDYFYQNNTYVFDRTKISDAHNSCKERAVHAVLSQMPVVVIDNTNVCYWEMKFYLELARRFNYVVIALEPRTPWRFDPEQLAARNSHEVPLSVITDRVKLYQEISPIYYGWFLNDIDSIFLLNIGKCWLERCWELAAFLKDFKQVCQVNTSEDFLDYFTHGNAPLDKDRLLHCTSRFTSRWEHQDKQYHDDPNVQASIGKVSVLRIIGFVVTERTFVARVALTEEQLTIWGGEDTIAGSPAPVDVVTNHDQESANQQPAVIDETGKHSPINETGKRSPVNESKTYSPPSKRFKKTGYQRPPHSKTEVVVPSNNLRGQDIVTSATLRVVSMNLCDSVTSGKGSKAHVTLGVSGGVSPATGGCDLEEVVRLEQLERMEPTKYPSNSYEIPGANIKQFARTTWAVYPHKTILCESIFSHFL